MAEVPGLLVLLLLADGRGWGRRCRGGRCRAGCRGRARGVVAGALVGGDSPLHHDDLVGGIVHLRGVDLAALGRIAGPVLVGLLRRPVGALCAALCGGGDDNRVVVPVRPRVALDVAWRVAVHVSLPLSLLLLE